MCCLVLRSTFALLLTIQFTSLFFLFFFATILSGPYLWNRYSQRLQTECAAWSCGLILHCCLPSNSLCYFFFFRHDFVRCRVFHLRGIAPRSHIGRLRTCLVIIGTANPSHKTLIPSYLFVLQFIFPFTNSIRFFNLFPYAIFFLFLIFAFLLLFQNV